jgi:hypothetical protein
VQPPLLLVSCVPLLCKCQGDQLQLLLLGCVQLLCVQLLCGCQGEEVHLLLMGCLEQPCGR